MAPSARGATLTWDASGSTPAAPTGGSGIWSNTNTNWSNGTSDTGWTVSTNDVYFSGTGGTVTLGSNITVNNLTVNSTAGTYTVGATSSYSITITGTITASKSFTISSSIAGSNGLTKTGGGTLTLYSSGSANTYTGNTAILNGTLVARATGALPTSTVVIIGGSTTTATLDIRASQTVAGIASANNSGSNTITGDSSSASVMLTINPDGAGSAAADSTFAGIIKDYDSTHILGITKAGSHTLTLTNTNSYTGATLINGGILSASQLSNGGIVSSIGASSNAAANLVINSGTLQYTGGAALTDRNFTIGDGGATIDASGSGALVMSGTAAYATLNAKRTLTLTGTSGVGNTYGGVLADNGTGTLSVVKSGSGTWILNAANTYTGETTITGGTLAVNGALAASSAVTVILDATLAGSGTVSGNVSATNGNINGSGLNLGSTTLYGKSTLSGYSIASSVVVADGTTTLTGTTRSISALRVSSGATLNANGTIDGSATVSGLFKGNSTVTGNLVLTSGTLSTGDSVGVTAIEGDFSMDSSSTLVAEVNGTQAGISYDQVQVSGNITLAGTLDLSKLSGLSFGEMIILIENTSSGTTSGYFSTIITNGHTYIITGSSSSYTMVIGGTEYLLNYSANAGSDGQYNDVILSVIPEPGTWGLLVAGTGLLGFLQRRCRRSAA